MKCSPASGFAVPATVKLFGAALLCSLAGAGSAPAQTVTWDRKAHGQHFNNPCNGDPNTGYTWPDNNAWTQQKVLQHITSPCDTTYVAQPSNWTTDTYPNSSSVDVVLGNSGGAPADLDRGGPSGHIAVHSLTILPAGGLTAEFGASLSYTTFDIQQDGSLPAQGGGGAWPTFTMAAGGTFQKSQGAGTFALDPGLVMLLPGGGTIASLSGTLQLSGNATHYVGPVSFNAASGAVIDLAPPSAVDAAVVLMTGLMTSNNNGGTVRLTGGWLSTVTNSGGATLNFSGDTFQWTGGAFRSTTADPFVNAGTLNITGAPSMLGQGFTNNSVIIQSGAGVLNLPYGSAMTNGTSGTIEFKNDNGFTVNGGGGAAPLFTNKGTIRKAAGTGNSILPKELSIGNIGGTIAVDTGTLSLGSGLSYRFGTGNGGTLQVAAGATLQLNDGTSNAVYHGQYTASGGGTILLAGGAIYPDDQQADGYTFNFPQGMFHWNGGTIVAPAGMPFTNAGFIAIGGPVGISSNGFQDNGTITIAGDGAMNAPYGSALTIGASGVFDIQNDSPITNNGGGGGNPLFTNTGTFMKSSGTGTNSIAPTFNNSGTVRVASGTLAFIDRFTQTAGVLDLSGGDISSQSGLLFRGGLVEGTGTITGNVTNDGGTFSPGHSPGKITVNGNYTQTSNGTLTMEIAGTGDGSYDQLVVNGTASLNGTLNIAAINGFSPKAGDTFALISASNLSGNFSTVNVTGFTGRVDVSSGAITVTVLTSARQLLNISTRMEVLSGENVLIGGFIVTGTDPKKVLIRGLGPELPVSGALADPVLELHHGSTVLASNDNWRDSQEQEIKDTTIPPTKDVESAMVQTLQPGSYTAVLSGKDGGTGVGQVEVYDLAAAAPSQLANISTRGFVDTGDNVMIGGVIIGGGSDGTTARVLVRAIGPSLSQQGVGNALQDPTLELHDANAQLVAENNNWRSDQEQAIKDTGVPPSDDRESAIIQTLAAGSYTAIVRGANNSTGIGLVELYNLQ